jgi:hypothetical protein
MNQSLGIDVPAYRMKALVRENVHDRFLITLSNGCYSERSTMNISVVVLLALTGLAAANPAVSGTEEELNRFHTLCKTDADVVVNGYEFKKSGLSYSMIADTIKTAFADKTQTSKDGSNDALYLIDLAYRLNPELKQEVIHEAAYQLCMKEKLSMDRKANP